jgi:hypothetical protein
MPSSPNSGAIRVPQLIIEDAEAAVSRGYVRGRLLVFRPVVPSDEASS